VLAQRLDVAQLQADGPDARREGVERLQLTVGEDVA
jgi:hypothetical protein